MAIRRVDRADNFRRIDGLRAKHDIFVNDQFIFLTGDLTTALNSLPPSGLNSEECVAFYIYITSLYRKLLKDSTRFLNKVENKQDVEAAKKIDASKQFLNDLIQKTELQLNKDRHITHPKNPEHPEIIIQRAHAFINEGNYELAELELKHFTHLEKMHTGSNLKLHIHQARAHLLNCKAKYLLSKKIPPKLTLLTNF